jgi:putative heme-binding domain-containing protein
MVIMKKRSILIAFAALAVVSLGETRGRTQGLAVDVTQGMVEETVAGTTFRTLPGFTIERVTPANRTDSYVVLTFDSQGRLVVSKENDSPRVLLDNDHDGIYESEQVLTDKVRNCQGLWFDGSTMYGACADPTVAAPARRGGGGGAAGAAPGGGRQGRDNAPRAGIFKLTDTNGDGVLDTVETLAHSGSIQEHGPHAIRRMPDGRFAVVVGNNETLLDPAVNLDSPVLRDKEAQLLPYLPNFGTSAREGAHSAIYPWNAATKTFDVFSGGNRNSYDFGFNLAGEAFLFDSDMEWDIGMPWYREVRLVHEIPNGDYGYRNGSGKYPPYYIDSLPPLVDLGRGSPVGVEFYTSYAYPKAYFDNIFIADWSRGRLVYSALTPSGASYTARTDRAEFVHGEPFNITDIEVGPDGMIYFSTGGRNTEGAVWRLRYTGPKPATPDMTGILAVVHQPQPLSSWGWAAIERAKASMGPAFGQQLEALARRTSADPMDRVRALYEMQRHGAAPSATLLGTLAADRAPLVRAAAMYVVGVQGAALKSLAAAGLKDADPLVRRRAAEDLVRMGQSPDRPSLAPVGDIYALLNDRDRLVRWAARIAIEHTNRADWADRVLAETNPLGAMDGLLAWVRTASGANLQPALDREFAWLQRTGLSVDDTLRLCRTLAYTATEIPDGLTPAQRVQLHTLLIDRFPSADERLNRELALLLAYAGQPEAIAKILAAVPKGNENQPLQLHYLYALRTMKQGWTDNEKAQLADLLGRASHWRGGAQFANFLGQMFDQAAEVFTTDAEKQMLYAKAPDYAPLTPAEVTAMAARGGGRGGRGGAGTGRGGRGGGAAADPLLARTQGRVLSKGEIFDEVIFTPRTQQPNADQGRAIFESSCASCHRFGSVGDDHGVAVLNLTATAPKTARKDLLESIMFPTRVITASGESTTIAKTDGTTITGLVVGESGQALTILQASGTTIDVQKSDVRSRQKTQATIMDDAITSAMSQPQLTNLLAYLQGSAAGGQ